jgi:choline dehydrogenase-like flavoprotein
MAGGWSKNFDIETDWNIITEPMEKVDYRQVKCSRGRFLGGSSGVNGTLCIRGTKQDYDDWDMEEWTGDKMFEYMKKVYINFTLIDVELNTNGNSQKHSTPRTGTEPKIVSTAPPAHYTPNRTT